MIFSSLTKPYFEIAIAAKQVFQTAKPPTDRYIDSRTLFQEFRRKHKDDSKSLSNVFYVGVYVCHVDVVVLECFVECYHRYEQNFVYLKGAKTLQYIQYMMFCFIWNDVFGFRFTYSLQWHGHFDILYK